MECDVSDEKSFFIKMKVNSEQPGFDDIFVSPDRSRIELWVAEEEEETVSEEGGTPEETNEKQPFANVATDYAKEMVVFRRTAPFVMSFFPFMRRANDEE
jgi:hypothetical protein